MLSRNLREPNRYKITKHQPRLDLYRTLASGEQPDLGGTTFQDIDAQEVPFQPIRLAVDDLAAKLMQLATDFTDCPGELKVLALDCEHACAPPSQDIDVAIIAI